MSHKSVIYETIILWKICDSCKVYLQKYIFNFENPVAGFLLLLKVNLTNFCVFSGLHLALCSFQYDASITCNITLNKIHKH